MTYFDLNYYCLVFQYCKCGPKSPTALDEGLEALGCVLHGLQDRILHYSNTFGCSHIFGSSGWFSAVPISLILRTHSKIVFRSVTLSLACYPNLLPSALCIKIANSPFFFVKKILHNKTSMLTRPRHGDDWKLYLLPELTEPAGMN